MAEIKFEKYAKMIEKKSWEVHMKTGVDVDELKAQCALIYVNTLDNYDPSKSSFSTIFYLSLNQLWEYAYYFRDRNRDGSLNLRKKDIGVMIKDYDPPKLKDFLDYAKTELSEGAYRIMEFIVRRSWDFKCRIKPTVSMIMREFGLTRATADTLWNECSDFWNKDGVAFYA